MPRLHVLQFLPMTWDLLFQFLGSIWWVPRKLITRYLQKKLRTDDWWEVVDWFWSVPRKLITRTSQNQEQLQKWSPYLVLLRLLLLLSSLGLRRALSFLDDCCQVAVVFLDNREGFYFKGWFSVFGYQLSILVFVSTEGQERRLGWGFLLPLGPCKRWELPLVRK